MALLNATGIWDGASLGSTANYCAATSKEEAHISSEDREGLRSLAQEVAFYAARPIEIEKRNLWTRHNDLEPTRPVIFCDPENGWNEIIAEDTLACEGSLARRWEMVLRKEIFWAEQMRDDKVIESCFDIGYTHSEEDWGLHEKQIGGTQGGSYAWERALKDERDIDNLHAPLIEIDRDASRAALDLATETLGDILQVRQAGLWWWSMGMTLDLCKLLGLEQTMIAMIDKPDLIHRLMGLLRDGNQQKLDWLENNDLLSTNTDRYVGSGGFGYTAELPGLGSGPDAPVEARHMWGFGESQETVAVSPGMFAELIFPYQLPLLERFGLNCYGCCEPLDARWDTVKTVPRLRRVSVSAWADVKKMAELLQRDYVFSYKPAPADLAVAAIDEETTRRKLRETMAATRGCRLEIIMKDNHTIGRNPQNVIRWARIAMEEADR